MGVVISAWGLATCEILEILARRTLYWGLLVEGERSRLECDERRLAMTMVEVKRILDSPGTRRWVQQEYTAVVDRRDRDIVDAIADAKVLIALLEATLDKSKLLSS